MMNRNIMQRQMFAKGGAAFPDLSGDGRVTRKDILMGRGVPMQMGGEPQMAELQAQAMAQGVGSMMPPPPAMPPAQGPMGNEEVMDPAVVEGMLIQAQENLGNIDEAEDYETVINTIRGEDAPISARYEELAEIVGEEDAAQTPESVLTLVQPAIVMGAVDQGIGGLAAEEMTAPVEGAMAQGIMSTVAPPPEPAMMAAPPAAPGPMMDPAMMGAGQTPPVNFNQGGLVRRGDNQPVQYYEKAGEVKAPSISSLGVTAPEVKGLREVYEQKLPLYTSIAGDPTAGLEEQKNLTQAQMLFDIAGTALAFAAPMQGERRGMSAAERLAMAATQTKLFPTIGARAQQQLDLKKAAQAEEKNLKLGALTAAETDIAAQQKALADYKKEELEGALKLSGIGYTKALELDNATKLQKDLYSKKDALQVKIKDIEANMAKASDERKAVLQADLLYVQGEQAKVLEGIKQTGREALQNTINTFKEKMNKLDQTQTLEAQNEKAKLDEQLKVLEANMRLTERDLMNEFELEKMGIGHEFATELQNSRLSVQESIASNSLAFKENQAKLNQARADEKLAIDQENLELQRAAEERITVFEQQSMDLKEREVALKEQEARIGKLNVEGKNKAQQILARPELLKGYAKGTLGEAETLAVNSAIDQLSTKETLPGPDGTTIKTGGNIPEAARQAVIARSKLTVPEGQTRLMPRDVERITAEPTEFGRATSKIMSKVPDASVAFGSDAVVRNVINTATEALTFGLAKAPYESTEKAISAVKQLNLDTVTHFQDIKELRDSVALLNMLKEQTADPNAFLTGDTRAKNKTQTVLDTIDDLISVLDLKIDNMTDVEELNEARLGKQKALQLRSGFEVINRAYSRLGSGGKTVTSSDEAKQDAILFGGSEK